MKLSGRIIVVGMFVLAIALSGGAWWHRLQESRHAAEFWGADAAPLVVGDTEATFLVLGDAVAQLHDRLARLAPLHGVDALHD